MAERTAVRVEAAPYIRRRIPNYEILDEEGLALIEANAETVLEEIGVRFSDNPGALALWRGAGAEVVSTRRLGWGLALLGAPSLAWSVWLTSTDPGPAYFVTPPVCGSWPSAPC